MEAKNTKFVSFSTQKGGVGKTTFTVLVASLLHYRMGHNVAVLDCDYPQYSLSRMREQDLKTVMQNEHFKHTVHKQFSQINKKAYPIITCKPNEAIERAQSFLAENPFQIDVVLFDMPGTVNTAGVLTVLSQMHHIFSPITADRVVIESTLSFTEVLSNIIAKNTQSAIESVHLFWNQVDGREKSPLYKIYEKVIADLNLPLMNAYISDSKRFRKDGTDNQKWAFRSTLLPANERLMKGCHLDDFITEFIQIVSL
ncbi:ParA family protein [Capnocytophaga felis]|uniref:Conjugal transfer protein TraA n=1 Tax=Capnocytophaga felis TaxID=2267611 RepID=A0A5M4BC66_9FLAO|nr:ParA family protein [Capnocytophaga felis]GET47159.1 conjugal transfer protein TraA [Capnocytophaga felis]GET49716.1 conjugal transfer protein TraA [Capnocytophaga felis]